MIEILELLQNIESTPLAITGACSAVASAVAELFVRNNEWGFGAIA